jgi:hypothetical protein
MTEKNIIDLIEKDSWMMEVLRAAEKMELPDWLIGAGFVRNKVWDHLHGYEKSTPPTDIDLVYFDTENKLEEKDVETQLSSLLPGPHWEVVNQATAHHWNGEKPYTSTADALSRWPETATAVGVFLANGQLHVVAPLGIEDLVTMVVQPTPAFMQSEEKRTRVRERILQKHWQEKWPKVTVANF